MINKYENILQAPDLLPIDKLLYIMIGYKSLADTTNTDLAERLGTTPRNIQRALHRLEQGGYIHIEYCEKNKNIRHVWQNVRHWGHTPSKAPSEQKQITDGFKKLYTDYTRKYTHAGWDYSKALIKYRALVEKGKNPTAIYNRLIAYRNEIINNADYLPPLDAVLRKRFYKRIKSV